jgi:hypothetical protein
MADLKYSVQIDTQKATQSLQRLQTGVGGMQTAFGGLRTALGALAFGAAIRGALGFAAAVNDMSQATNVSRASILGLGQALTTNGGQASKATDAVQRFSLTLGNAAEGSKSAQDAFSSVGISLEDLGRLDESELLARTIEGLGAIEDSGRRAAIQAQIFGKTMAGVNAAGLATNFRQVAIEQERNAEAVRKAGEAQDKLNSAMNKFQTAVIRTIEPLVDAFNRLSDEQISSLIESVVKLAAALGSLVVATKVFGAIGLAITGFAGYLALAKIGMGELSKTIAVFTGSRIPGAIKGLRQASGVLGVFSSLWLTLKINITKTIPFLLAAFAKFLPLAVAVGAALFVVNEAVRAITGTSLAQWIGKTVDRVKELFGIVNTGADTAGDAAVTAANKAADANKTIVDAQAEAKKKAAEAARAAALEFKKELQALNELTGAYRNSINSAAEYYQLQTDNIGQSEKQRDINEQRFGAEQTYLNQVTDLTRQYNTARLKASEGDANAARLMPEISRAIEQVTTAYQRQVQGIYQLVQARARALGQDQLIKFQTQEQIRLQRDLQKVQDDTAKLGMTRIEQKYYDITAAARASARAAIEAEQARRGSELDVDEVKAYYAAALAGTEKLKRAQADFSRQSRSFSAGWKQAFNDYVDDATNAAAVAGRLFDKFTKGLEDAIVDFAKTGKFNWKKFVAEMSEELLRAQIRKTIANLGKAFGLDDLFGGGAPGSSAKNPMYVRDVDGGGIGAGGAQGGGGVGGGIIGAAKTAASGIWESIKAGVSRIFGGSEASEATGGIWATIKNTASTLFNSSLKGISGLMGSFGSSISKLLSSAGSGLGNMANSLMKSVSGMFSGIKGGGSSALKSIGSAVSSVFSGSKSKGGGILDSIVSGAKSLFGGFFANGGTLPRGKFGIVGERGPELISGPGQITPLQGLGGGSTNVTYNISAVDAASFQALIARDPGFIHAVAMQGARGIPAKR